VALKVEAEYDLRAPRTLSLVFREARVMEVRVSDAIETLLAPALLPRGGFNHQLLLWLRELELRFPLLGAGAPPRNDTPGVSDAATSGGAPVGNYEISYVDDDVMVGRANRLGTFVFVRHGPWAP
jgi:hypothetical protein